MIKLRKLWMRITGCSTDKMWTVCYGNRNNRFYLCVDHSSFYMSNNVRGMIVLDTLDKSQELIDFLRTRSDQAEILYIYNVLTKEIIK